MTSWYQSTSKDADDAINRSLQSILDISNEVSALGVAWHKVLEAVLESAPAGSTAFIALREKPITAKFLSLSSERTENRIKIFANALNTLPRPRFSNNPPGVADWGGWLSKKTLAPKLAEVTNQISIASKIAAEELKQNKILSRQSYMKKALGNLTKVGIGFIPGGHTFIAATEAVHAVHEIHQGLSNGFEKTTGPLVTGLNEIDSFQKCLLALESCLYLIPSHDDVIAEVSPTNADSSNRLTEELTNFLASNPS